MKIDPTIFDAIAGGELTIEHVLEATMQTVLEYVAADCRAAGFAEADIQREIERLRKAPPAQIETLREMLESRAMSLQ